MPRPDAHAVLAELSEPLAYERELRALIKRHAARPGRRAWTQAGLELADWDPRLCAQIGKMLARSVPRGEYRFGVFSPRRAVIGGKERTLYRPSIADVAVLAVAARVLRALSERVLSQRVYSYRPGRSALHAVRDFAGFVRAHRRALPDPRQRGLFVLRRDITRYGESIPVDASSALWPLLSELWGRAGIDEAHPFVALTKEAIRPRVLAPDAGETRLDRGVPTGSPIQPVICNLYLSALDRRLGVVEQGFYARYGDDILFAHAGQEHAIRASSTIAKVVDELGLSMKPEKMADFYFTGCGRPASEAHGARGTMFIEYLGMRVAFSGAIGLTTEKARRFLRDLLWRAENTANSLRPSGPAAPAPALEAVCGALESALDARRSVAAPLSGIVRHAVDDRAQLRHLDYLLALGVARRLTRQRGVRAFRKLPYAKLRRAGLPSLLVHKNRPRVGSSTSASTADLDDGDGDAD